MTPPQAGQDQASSFHACPAATQTTFLQEEAAQVTSGSSALAMTTASVSWRPSRHFSAIIRVSAARSSWSRERLSRAIALGWVSRATPARYFSSTSMTPKRASEPPARAEVMPAGMLAPRALETTGPAARSASAISRVVVVFPLVALTSTTSRWSARVASRSGSSLRAILPPITEPLPRPAFWERAAATLPAVTAILARAGSEASRAPVGSDSVPAMLSGSSLLRHRPGPDNGPLGGGDGASLPTPPPGSVLRTPRRLPRRARRPGRPGADGPSGQAVYGRASHRPGRPGGAVRFPAGGHGDGPDGGDRRPARGAP